MENSEKLDVLVKYGNGQRFLFLVRAAWGRHVTIQNKQSGDLREQRGIIDGPLTKAGPGQVGTAPSGPGAPQQEEEMLSGAAHWGLKYEQLMDRLQTQGGCVGDLEFCLSGSKYFKEKLKWLV